MEGLVLLAIMLFSFGPEIARAQLATANHARIELLSEESSFRPGQTLWVGLFFQLDSGWHIYWQNPGDSGEPPTVQWALPKGFRAGAIRWPVPIRLGSKTVVDYGYEGQVLLMLPVQTPPNSSAARTSIGATVRYLVCREICIPARAQASLDIPVAKDTATHFSVSRELFQKTRALFPRAAPSAWKISVASHRDEFIISVEGGSASPTALFLPLDSDVIENSKPQTVESTRHGFSITLQKSTLLEKPVSTLRGVLVLEPGLAYRVAVPVLPR